MIELRGLPGCERPVDRTDDIAYDDVFRRPRERMPAGFDHPRGFGVEVGRIEPHHAGQGLAVGEARIRGHQPVGDAQVEQFLTEAGYDRLRTASSTHG